MSDTLTPFRCEPRFDIEIIDRVLAWSGSERAAHTWYRSQPLPSFGDRTAEDLVVAGHGEAVKTYSIGTLGCP